MTAPMKSFMIEAAVVGNKRKDSQQESAVSGDSGKRLKSKSVDKKSEVCCKH